MRVRDAWTLWGKIEDEQQVYEIRRGPDAPVTVWRGKCRRPIGYVTDYELGMARRGSVPVICLDPPVIAELAGDVINLRQAIGKLIRLDNPGAVVGMRDLVVKLPAPA
ncbi:MAG: hypothetical protein ACRD0P_03770 [Stackebrandtia sp.]